MPDENTDPGIVTPLVLYKEIRGHRKETGEQLAIIDKRVTKVETTVDFMVPKLERACKKANGASAASDNIKGQWKVLLYFMAAGIAGILGWLLREVFVG
jgi:hypothetical protein